MKPPRVADFDPNAKPADETPRLGSPMDGLAKIARPSPRPESDKRVAAELAGTAGRDDPKASRLSHPAASPAGTATDKAKTGKRAKTNDDPAVNKVGFYFTRQEIDALDQLVTRLTPRLRDEFGIRATKNELIRAFLATGLHDIEAHGFASAVLKLITSK